MGLTNESAPQGPQQISPGQSAAAIAAVGAKAAHMTSTNEFAPKGPKQISPGQSGAAIAAKRRPGDGFRNGSVALKGRVSRSGSD
jgi:hypothetical protein